MPMRRDMTMKMLAAILFTFSIICGTAPASDEPVVGEKVFDNASYPQRVGNSGLISFYQYERIDNKTFNQLVIGDPETGEVEPFDLELDDPLPPGQLAWSNDGEHLVVVRDDLTICDLYKYTRKKPFEIERLTDLRPYVVDYDSIFKEQFKIEDEMLMNASLLEWSPGDTMIAFNMLRVTDAAVWVLNINSGEVRQVTESKFGAGPSWTPDGKHLYISGKSQPQGKFTENIFRLDLDDYSVEPVLTDQATERLPEVSPDGKYLVYIRFSTGEAQGIYVYDIENDRTARLIDQKDKFGGASYPTWSHDGKYVYYQIIVPGEMFPAIYRIEFDPSIFE